jgi:hypothetical protein
VDFICRATLQAVDRNRLNLMRTVPKFFRIVSELSPKDFSAAQSSISIKQTQPHFLAPEKTNFQGQEAVQAGGVLNGILDEMGAPGN